MVDPKDGFEKLVCQCRPDMKFDTKNMECRIFIDVDCAYIEKRNISSDEQTISTNTFKSQAQAQANTAFCNLIDRSISISS